MEEEETALERRPGLCGADGPVSGWTASEPIRSFVTAASVSVYGLTDTAVGTRSSNHALATPITSPAGHNNASRRHKGALCPSIQCTISVTTINPTTIESTDPPRMPRSCAKVQARAVARAS